jgi:hypothetical protein
VTNTDASETIEERIVHATGAGGGGPRGGRRDECPARLEAALSKESPMTNTTVSLPDDLTREARAAGLLDDEAIAALLREAIRRPAVDRLFENMAKLAALEPPLTEAEIDAEIAAARAERARRR